jgi:hypothetical protein
LQTATANQSRKQSELLIRILIATANQKLQTKNRKPQTATRKQEAKRVINTVSTIFFASRSFYLNIRNIIEDPQWSY